MVGRVKVDSLSVWNLKADWQYPFLLARYSFSEGCRVTSISVTASSQLESLVASGSKTIVSVDIQALGMKNLDVHDNKLGQKEGEFTLGTVTIKKSGSTSCSSFTSWGGLPIESICASGNALRATGNKDSNNNYQWMGSPLGSTVSASLSCDPSWTAIFHNDDFGIILYKNGSTLTSSTRNEGHWGSGTTTVSIDNYEFKGTISDVMKIRLYVNKRDSDADSAGTFNVLPFDCSTD